MPLIACSKRSDGGEQCEVKKAMKSRGGLASFYFFALLFTSHRSPLSERLEQAMPLKGTQTWRLHTKLYKFG